MAAAKTRKYPEENHWRSDSEACNAPDKVGRATLSTVPSTPTAKIARLRAPSAHHLRAPSTSSDIDEFSRTVVTGILLKMTRRQAPCERLTVGNSPFRTGHLLDLQSSATRVGSNTFGVCILSRVLGRIKCSSVLARTLHVVPPKRKRTCNSKTMSHHLPSPPSN